MYCFNCGSQIPDNSENCPNCGANRKQTGLSQAVTQPVQSVVESGNRNIQTQSVSVNPSNNVKKRNIIIIVILMIAAISIVGVILISSLPDKEEKEVSKEPDKVEQENTTNSTYQLLKKDYEEGKIDINKYFTELVNFEYDSSKLDRNYQSSVFTTSSSDEILKLIEEHKDELDKELVQKYVENALLANVTLGDSSTTVQQTNSSKGYEVKFLGEEEQSNISNHVLDKVRLSKNGHFLIWYTTEGDDGITDDQAKLIADGLEDTVAQYTQIFHIPYSYSADKDAFYKKDYKRAKATLEASQIPLSTLDTAMSVYIYNTGSEGVCATYVHASKANAFAEVVLWLGIYDSFKGDNGAVAFPYIVINKSAISSEEYFSQIYRHELFHHFQSRFCFSTTGKECPLVNYADGLANFASAITSKEKSTDIFLNGWMGVYTRNTSTRLEEITDGASYGYGTFPFFYIYSQVVDNWVDVLMPAHAEDDPYTYIKYHTSKEDFIEIMDQLSYKLLVKDFGSNNALKTSKNVVVKNTLSTAQNRDEWINGGAIDYFEITGDNTLEVTSKASNDLGMKLYGYKDGNYTELASNREHIEVDLTYYARYDKFYLVVSNSDITNARNYEIIMKNSKFQENEEFKTTFKNYNIEIEMNLSVSGVSTRTISKGVMDEVHQKQYLDVTTISMETFTLTNKMYHDYNAGYTYLTQPYGGDVWWKEKASPQIVDLGVILDKLIHMKNVTKISDNHYKIKMTSDEVKGLMASGNANASSISGDIYVEVYTENGYITKLEYDFTGMIKGVDTFTTTIKCSNYDQAGDVEIPQSVIDNAKVQS